MRCRTHTLIIAVKALLMLVTVLSCSDDTGVRTKPPASKVIINGEIKQPFADTIYNSIYIEDRIEAERKHYRLKMSLVISVPVIVLVAVLTYLFILRIRNARLKAENSASRIMTEKQSVEQTHAKLSFKYDMLCKQYEVMLKDVNKRTSDNNALRNMITSRMESYFKVIISMIVYDRLIEETENEMRMQVEDRKSFLDNIRQYTALTYPELEQYLIEHGLTEREIDFCNLYIIGLRGNEIGNYLGLARHYTVSSGIRKKLGLGERDINIDAHLRQFIEGLRQT